MIATAVKGQASPYWWGLAAAGSAVAYPFTALPVFLAAHMPSSAGQVLLFSLAAALVLAFPACGLWLLVGTAGEATERALVRRGLGMLLILAPVLRVFSGIVSAVVHIPDKSTLVWFSLWAAIAAVMLWRIAHPAPVFSARVVSKIKFVHAVSAIAIGLFILAHLATNLTILKSPETYTWSASLLRLAYRTPVAEPILVGLLILQVITGLTMGAEAFTRRGSAEYLIQLACGVYSVVFLGSHTLAIAVLGRELLNRGPDFTYASAGPGGLLSSPDGVFLAPYYCLSVMAFFTHLSRPLRLWVMRMASSGTARRSSYALVGIGGVVAAALLIGLCTPMITTHGPHRFPVAQHR